MDHVGPMARTVEDVALMLGVTAGYDSSDPYSRNVDVPRYTDAINADIKGMRLGIPKTYFYETVAPDVDSAIQRALRALESLGADLVEVSLPNVPVHRAVWLQIASPEAYSYHEDRLRNYADQYGADVRGRLEAGRELLSIDYVRAQRVRTMMKEECKRLFQNVSAIVTPTTPIVAPRIDELRKPGGPEAALASIPRFTRFSNIVGLPSISIPCGFNEDGLPIGMQIVGKAFDEATVLRVAHAYEQNAKWFERRPDDNV